MGNYTTNLSLYNTDMTTDGNDTFDFQRDLNDNNDKIDSAIGKLSNLSTTTKDNLVDAINEVFNGSFANQDLSNLTVTGSQKFVQRLGDTMTGVLYGVASNANNSVLTTVSCNIQSGGWGYVKYGNGLIIQWGGIASGSTSRTINLSTAFSNGDYTVVIGERRGDVPTRNIVVSSRGTTSFNVLLGDNSTYGNWMAIGM